MIVLTIIFIVILIIVLTLLFVDYIDNHNIDLSIINKDKTRSKHRNSNSPRPVNDYTNAVNEFRNISKSLSDMNIKTCYTGKYDSSKVYKIGDYVDYRGSTFIFDGNKWIRLF